MYGAVFYDRSPDGKETEIIDKEIIEIIQRKIKTGST